MNFIVCDAGGSTVDTTVYSVASARPVLNLKEKRASACEFIIYYFISFLYRPFWQASKREVFSLMRRLKNTYVSYLGMPKCRETIWMSI